MITIDIVESATCIFSRPGNDRWCGCSAYGGEVAGTHMPFSSGRFLAGSISRQTCWPPLLKNADIAPFFPHDTRPMAATSLRRRRRSRTQKNEQRQHTLLLLHAVTIILLTQLKYYYY